ncbi:uncharacterized protein si:ch73-95l15.5 isoform X2 [Pristis pectinata]|uniref:uncharacterized protein si:ch73-95l15.5 isoform X2 n=1 Tax=Pristis pectinata TaxID=685728 RepID=UPI00223E6C54|nr:uncharacterized protein si:ch73-95l15.5 isoform X2 [Pristis pectinata]
MREAGDDQTWSTCCYVRSGPGRRDVAMNELCRVCGAELKGNQRRWIFSGRSAVDLRVVLSHVLGRRVSRGEGGEFLCGKCASTLERVQRFDGVIARVQALSIERVRRLLTEKGRLASLLRRLHGRAPAAGPGGREQAERDYAALLRDDMRLAGYESWSEGSEAAPCPGPCPGPGPCPNRRCLGCSALRVSDDRYDAVCRVPRRLARALASGRLSRSRSSSELPGGSRSPEWPGSPVSPGASPWLASPPPVSRSLSASSLGAATGSDVGSEGLASDDLAWSSASPDQTLAALAQQLEGVAYRPVRALPHSRIPVLVRGGAARTASGSDTPRQRLSYSGDEESVPGISDEYRPLNLQKLLDLQQKPGVLHQAAGQLSEEGRMEETPALEKKPGSWPKTNQGLSEYTGHRLVRGLARDLRSKEQLLQECVRLIKDLTTGDRSTTGPEADGIRTLCLWLDKREEGLEASDEMLGVLEEMEGEVQRLRQALHEKDGGIRRLGQVLACNEEMINMLNLCLGQKEEQLQQLCQSAERARQLWQEERDSAVRGQEGLLQQQAAALQSLAGDVEALSDSLLARGLDGGPDSSAGLCLRLRDKERLLSEARAELSRQHADQQRVIQELSQSLAEREQLIQELMVQKGQTRASHAQELRCASQQLSARDGEVRRLSELQSSTVRDHHAELVHLQVLLYSKDQLILGLLEDGRSRDRILSELQEQLHAGTAPKVNVKQTL